MAMVCSLWDSCDRSAKLCEIVELNMDPEDADTARALNDGILFSEYCSKLQEDTMQCLDHLKEDNLGSQVSGWLEQFQTGPPQLMCTSTGPSPLYVYQVDYPISEMRMSYQPSIIHMYAARKSSNSWSMSAMLRITKTSKQPVVYMMMMACPVVR